jgi:hypothetical protein
MYTALHYQNIALLPRPILKLIYFPHSYTPKEYIPNWDRRKAKFAKNSCMDGGWGCNRRASDRDKSIAQKSD